MRRRVLLGLGAVLILALMPTCLAHLFFWRVEHELSLRIDHKPLFASWPGFIRLEPVILNWQDRLQVKSGRLAVRFPISAVVRREFPISLKGENLTVELGSELKKVVGQEGIIFDRISAKFRIKSDRGVDIDFLDAESKTIQFHLTSASPKQSAKSS